MTPRPALVTSVRDILQERIKPGRDAETVEILNRHFDLVMVHGDPAFATLGDTFPLAAAIEAGDRLHRHGGGSRGASLRPSATMSSCRPAAARPAACWCGAAVAAAHDRRRLAGLVPGDRPQPAAGGSMTQRWRRHRPVSSLSLQEGLPVAARRVGAVRFASRLQYRLRRAAGRLPRDPRAVRRGRRDGADGARRAAAAAGPGRRSSPRRSCRRPCSARRSSASWQDPSRLRMRSISTGRANPRALLRRMVAKRIANG